MNDEPKPGARLAAQDFASAVRLTPLVSMDLVVRSPDGRVLLGRRSYEPAKDRLFVPGGRITKNETLAAAFNRLCLAELGAEGKIEAARFLGVFEHFYPTNGLEQPGFGTHYVVLAFEMKAPAPNSALPKDQHAEFAWMTAEQILASPEVHEYTKAYFRPLNKPTTLVR